MGGGSPTFDPGAGTMLLRKSGRIDKGAPGERIPTLAYPGGLWLVQRDGVWPLGGTMAATTIGTRAFTLNAKRGELILDAREQHTVRVCGKIEALDGLSIEVAHAEPQCNVLIGLDAIRRLGRIGVADARAVRPSRQRRYHGTSRL